MGYVLVTGSNGIIGEKVVQGLLDVGIRVFGVSAESEAAIKNKNYLYKNMDLTDCLTFEALLNSYEITHIVHLAAIAHRPKGMEISWNDYYRINTLCSKTLFRYANNKNIPILFTSTVDVYGITDGNITPKSQINPIGKYAKSKYLAEIALKEICNDGSFTIVRLAPVYKPGNKDDLYKRIYLKEPNWAYRIGKGMIYEVLNIDKIVETIVIWIKNTNDTVPYKVAILSDQVPCDTAEFLKKEKEIARAKHIIVIPMWLAKLMAWVVAVLFGKQSYYAFMWAKLIRPIKLERNEIS